MKRKLNQKNEQKVNLHTVLEQFKSNCDLYNLNFKNNIKLQCEYDDGGELNKKLEITFNYKKYFVFCLFDFFFHLNPKTKEYDFFCFGSQNYQNSKYIAFYSSEEAKKAKKGCIENPDIAKKDLCELFDFIHNFSLYLCDFDPFATVYFDDSNDEEQINNYQQYVKDYNNGYNVKKCDAIL